MRFPGVATQNVVPISFVGLVVVTLGSALFDLALMPTGTAYLPPLLGVGAFALFILALVITAVAVTSRLM